MFASAPTGLLRVAGPASGAVLIAVAGLGAAVVVDAATFLISAVVLLRIRRPAASTRTTPEPLSTALRTGWRGGGVPNPAVDLDREFHRIQRGGGARRTRARAAMALTALTLAASVANVAVPAVRRVSGGTHAVPSGDADVQIAGVPAAARERIAVAARLLAEACSGRVR